MLYFIILDYFILLLIYKFFNHFKIIKDGNPDFEYNIIVYTDYYNTITEIDNAISIVVLCMAFSKLTIICDNCEQRARL